MTLTVESLKKLVKNINKLEDSAIVKIEENAERATIKDQQDKVIAWIAKRRQTSLTDI